MPLISPFAARQKISLLGYFVGVITINLDHIEMTFAIFNDVCPVGQMMCASLGVPGESRIAVRGEWAGVYTQSSFAMMIYNSLRN